MTPRLLRSAPLALLAGLLLTTAPVSPADAAKVDEAKHGGRPLYANLNGANEVAGGDSDGTGSAKITLNQGQGEVCWKLDVDDIAQPTRAHIHVGVAGVNGSIVVTLFESNNAPTSFPAEGCATGISEDTIKQIRKQPGGYYVNVHNTAFPAGAIRGQLSKKKS